MVQPVPRGRLFFTATAAGVQTEQHAEASLMLGAKVKVNMWIYLRMRLPIASVMYIDP
jgi:hypothetical protein